MWVVLQMSHLEAFFPINEWGADTDDDTDLVENRQTLPLMF